MPSRRQLVVLLAVVVPSLAPMSYSSEAGFHVTAAACETCCREEEATCIVCGTAECMERPTRYLGRIGSPCSQQTPDV